MYLSVNEAFAQPGNSGYPNYSGSAADKERSEYYKALFDEFDYDEYKLNSQLYQDSLDIEQKVLLSPEELRKLGINKEVIEELIRLNGQQDSVKNVQLEYERLVKKRDNIEDSISMEDIEELIELQKRAILAKALSLPPSNVFGHEFFRKSMLKLSEQESESKASGNYIIGAEDEINIVMWGYTEYDEVFKVDKNGAINPPVIGRIYLRGLTFENARELIKSKYSQNYDLQNSKIDISLVYSRVVSVNLVGELFNPGTYTFPATNTVFNALVAIDGPNQIGSIRNITVKRDGETVRKLDLYKLLTDPSSNHDFFLEDNDYVVVPPLNKVIGITGEIKRPHSYELIANEGLVDLVKYCGGLNASGYRKNISIKRIAESQEVLIDVNLDSLSRYNRDFLLMDGDSVFVYKIPQVLRNFVHIQGAVKVPGNYEIRKGDKVMDVLNRAKGLVDEAITERAYVLSLDDDLNKELKIVDIEAIYENPRSNENVALRNLDTIRIISKQDFRQDFPLKISGAISKPGTYSYADGMTLKDALFLAGGLKKEAATNRIEISRILNFQDDQIELDDNGVAIDAGTRTVIKRAEVGFDLSINDGSEEFILKPYDNIFVRFSPNFQLQQNVKIFGEVVYPGEYSLVNKNERFTDLLVRAGGLTEYASLGGTTLYRGQDSIGFVFIDLEDVVRRDYSKYNYILTDGDSIFIAKERDLVSISGSVNYPNIDSIGQINVPYEGKRRANHYISKFGAGFNSEAKRRNTFVIQANGEVQNARNYVLFRIYPKVNKGATIFVDKRDRFKDGNRKKKRREDQDWNENFDKWSVRLTSILTILILAQQLSN